MYNIFKDIIPLLTAFLVVVLVLYLTFFSTKYIAKKTAAPSKSKFMRIVDRLVLGQEQSIAIVEVNEHFYLIGVSQGGVKLLSEISKEEFTLKEESKEENSQAPGDFKKIITKLMSRNDK